VETSPHREITGTGGLPLAGRTAAGETAAVRLGKPAPHAIVIGAGFGGLAAAIRLAVKGYRVTLVERLDQAGGRAYVHRRGGYIFDAGPTIITAPQLFEELWALCGQTLQDDVHLTLMDPFYRVQFDDGSYFNYRGTVDAMRNEVARFCPADLAGYDKFLAEAERCYELGFHGLGAKAFDSVFDLFAAIPALIKMRAWRTMHQMVAHYIKYPKLRIVFTLQSLLIGGNPFSVSCVYSLIASLERRYGVHWAMGGTGALIKGLLKLAQGLGVEVRCNTTVAKINVVPDAATPRAKGVTLANGETLQADLVVCNSDAAWTYKNLIEPRFRRVWTDTKLARADYSMSLFVWYFGTSRQYPEVPHHMMLLGPRYQDLLRDIFKRKVLAQDFSLYLHRPTATDANMAPPGCDTFYALAPVPHLDSGTDWRVVGEAFRQSIEKRLSATVLPGLQAHITESFFTTPQDFHDRLLSEKGAAFGFEPHLLQSAWFRPHNRSEDIAGLYMVGAGTHPGAGVPGVLSSAKALDSVIPHASQYQGRNT
jgi:phytoene desaturase